jgi:hypothetical protein
MSFSSLILKKTNYNNKQLILRTQNRKSLEIIFCLPRFQNGFIISIPKTFKFLFFHVLLIISFNVLGILDIFLVLFS